MTRVGVRELRQRASELLRRVEQGETIEVTDRGRPVAMLAPLPGQTGLAGLRATGQLDVATGDLDDLPEPLEIDGGARPASDVLRALRRDER